MQFFPAGGTIKNALRRQLFNPSANDVQLFEGVLQLGCHVADSLGLDYFAIFDWFGDVRRVRNEGGVDWGTRTLLLRQLVIRVVLIVAPRLLAPIKVLGPRLQAVEVGPFAEVAGCPFGLEADLLQDEYI